MRRSRFGVRWANVTFAVALTLQMSAGRAHAAAPEPGFAKPSLFRGVFAIDNAPAATPREWSGLFAPGSSPAERAFRLDADDRTAVVPPPQAPLYRPPPRPAGQPSITWGPLLGNAFLFLVSQHVWRATFEKTTWSDTLEGAFWDDYVTSVKNFCCWDDGDKFSTNYLFHPAMGSVVSFIFANNHYASEVTPPGADGAYWNAKAKQWLFALGYSTYFELGLVLSEAAIGNVGLDGHGMTWEDVIVTPSVGVMLSAGEDYLRSTLIDRIDRGNHTWGIVAALCLNPTRSVANLFTFRKPWADPEWLTLRREARAREQARRQAPGTVAVR